MCIARIIAHTKASLRIRTVVRRRLWSHPQSREEIAGRGTKRAPASAESVAVIPCQERCFSRSTWLGRPLWRSDGEDRARSSLKFRWTTTSVFAGSSSTQNDSLSGEVPLRCSVLWSMKRRRGSGVQVTELPRPRLGRSCRQLGWASFELESVTALSFCVRLGTNVFLDESECFVISDFVN